MGEFFKIAADILATVLPDSDVGKVIFLLIIVFLVLVVTGRFPLKWIGVSIRHICRWLRCKIRDKHRYFQDGIGWIDFNSGRHTGTFRCDVCGKVWVVR